MQVTNHMRYDIYYMNSPFDKGLSKEQKEFLLNEDYNHAHHSVECREKVRWAKERKLQIRIIYKCRESDDTYEDVTKRYTGHERIRQEGERK